MLEFWTLSYKAYGPDAYAYLVFPWLILVLWLRWLPKWHQSVLLVAIGLAVFPPIAAAMAQLGQDAKTYVSLIGPALGAILVTALRSSRPAAPNSAPTEPDSRWKVLLAFVGSSAMVVVLGVVAPDGRQNRDRERTAEIAVSEVAGPTYVEDFKRAMDVRDQWGAYAAYREASRYLDLEAIRPVIDLYAEMDDPTGIAFAALEARREGRSEDRRRLEALAAEQNEPLGMVLALETMRADEMSLGTRQRAPSDERQKYSERLLEIGEYAEVAMACAFFTKSEEEAGDGAACQRRDGESLRVTALTAPIMGLARFPPVRSGGEPVDWTVTPAFVDGIRPRQSRVGDVTVVSEISTAKAELHKHLGWPGDIWEGSMTAAEVVEDLREGVKLENPKAGMLLHEASFQPGYRDLIGPEEARDALQMAANWGHSAAMMRLSRIRENGVGGFKQDRVLALALLVARERYLGVGDESGVEDANRLVAALNEVERQTAEFTAKHWRPGYLMVLFDPARWEDTTAE